MIRPLKILVTVIIKNSTPEHHKWSPEAEEENHMSLGVIPLRLSAPGTRDAIFQCWCSVKKAAPGTVNTYPTFPNGLQH